MRNGCLISLAGWIWLLLAVGCQPPGRPFVAGNETPIYLLDSVNPLTLVARITLPVDFPVAKDQLAMASVVVTYSGESALHGGADQVASLVLAIYQEQEEIPTTDIQQETGKLQWDFEILPGENSPFYAEYEMVFSRNDGMAENLYCYFSFHGTFPLGSAYAQHLGGHDISIEIFKPEVTP